MHELCLHKIGPDKSDQAIGPELQNDQKSSKTPNKVQKHTNRKHHHN